MKLLRIFLPVIVAFFLMAILLAWSKQSAQAHDLQPGDLPIFDSSQVSLPNVPQSSNVISTVLPAGDEYIHGLIYYEGYLYASTRSSYPSFARVLKIDPNTLNVITSTTLTTLFDGEDIVAANGYIWVILFTEPATLVRLDPNTLAWNTAVSFTGTVTTTMGAGESLKYAFGSLWAGGRDHLAQVDITNPLTPTYQLYDLSSLNLPTSSAGLLGSLAYDDQYLWATYKQYSGTQQSGDFYASTVVKMNPNDPLGVYTKTEISTDTPDDSAFTSGAYFVGGEGRPNATTPSDIYKFNSDPAIYTATKVADSATYGLFADSSEPQYVWGAYVGSPGIVKRFNLDATPLMTITLPVGFNDPSEIAFDPSGNVYVATWQSPSRVVKLTSQDLTSDLRIGMSDLPDPVYAGNEITYTLTITNDGPVDTFGVLITDTLPSQLNFVSSIPGSPQCSMNNGDLTCAIGNLNANSSKQVVLSAQVDAKASGTITNTAVISSALPDPNQSNNTALEKTVVKSAAADIAIGVDSSPNPVTAGQLLTYTLTITNSGPSNAAGIVVTDTLPAQVSFVASLPASPGCSLSGAMVICQLGPMNAFTNQKVTVMTRVGDLATGMISNTVKVSSSIADPNQQNNSSVSQTSVINSADLKIQNSENKTKAALGDVLVYTITVDNLGPTRALNLALQDVLPSGVDLISISPGALACTPQNGTVNCTLAKLAANNGVVLQLTVAINMVAMSNLHNVASVTALTPDPDMSNNTTSSDTSVFHRLFLPVTR